MDTFMGYERADGTVGVRNCVAVVPSVSCANGVVEAIARAVPEVVPLYHVHGCGRAGFDLELHTRAMQNICKSPNFAAVLIVGLGCEVVGAEGMALSSLVAGRTQARLMIQEEGGSQKTAAKGIDIARGFVRDAAKLEPTPVPLDRLIVGLECGGSDAFSGITANPAVGRAVDRLVAAGATAILTETTEMTGTAHILERRAADEATAQRIRAIIEDNEAEAERVLGPFAKLAISPGNMDGGMSSIREKSLGCIIKGGTSPINQVVDYAEPPTAKGLVIMNGPGYDTESLTGMAACGAQITIFTTGRGNPIGHPAMPIIKVASTSKMYRNMQDDMDVNAGEILEGASLQAKGDEIYDLLLAVANGQSSKAEMNRQNGLLCVYSRTSSF